MKIKAYLCRENPTILTIIMHTTTFIALLTAACVLGFVFAALAVVKIHNLSHHHYRITGDEVRITNQKTDRIL